MQTATELLSRPPTREWTALESLAIDYLCEPGHDRLYLIAREALGDVPLQQLRLAEPGPGAWVTADLLLVGKHGGDLREEWAEVTRRRLNNELERRLEAAKTWVPTPEELGPGVILDHYKHIMPGRERLAEEAKAWRKSATIGQPPEEFEWDPDRGQWGSRDGLSLSGKEVLIPVHLALDGEAVEELSTRSCLAGAVIVLTAALDNATALYFDDRHAHRIQLGEEFRRQVEARTRKAPPALVV